MADLEKNSFEIAVKKVEDPFLSEVMKFTMVMELAIEHLCKAHKAANGKCEKVALSNLEQNARILWTSGKIIHRDGCLLRFPNGRTNV